MLIDSLEFIVTWARLFQSPVWLLFDGLGYPLRFWVDLAQQSQAVRMISFIGIPLGGYAVYSFGKWIVGLFRKMRE